MTFKKMYFKNYVLYNFKSIYYCFYSKSFHYLFNLKISNIDVLIEYCGKYTKPTIYQTKIYQTINRIVWQNIPSEQIFKGSIFNLSKDHLRLNVRGDDSLTIG